MRKERHREQNKRGKRGLRCRIVKSMKEKIEIQKEGERGDKLRGILAEKQESSTGRGYKGARK